VHVVGVPLATLGGVQASEDTLRLGVTVTIEVGVLAPSVAVTVTV
jgi:hypothetical protein